MSWWTENLNFITDGNGKMISDPNEIENPIHFLPFIDIAREEDKDFKYWVENESKLVRFHLDASKIISDIVEIMNRQGFSIGFLASVKKPTSLTLASNKILWQPLDPNKPELNPSFDFKTPNADLSGSLSILESLMMLFLACEGVDPKQLNGVLKAEGFQSGIDRFISLIQQFDATKGDIALFKDVESQLLNIYIKWNNVLLGSPLYMNGTQTQGLNENIDVHVEYHRPEVVQTKQEKEDGLIKLIDAGLESRVGAIQKLMDVNEQQAIDEVNRIDSQESLIVNNPVDSVGKNVCQS